MVPRPDIFSLPGDLSLDDALARVVEEQHSRIPVYDPQSGPEHIIGVLYAKDLMRWTRLRAHANPAQPIASRIAAMKISQIMHDVLVVPETKVALRTARRIQRAQAAPGDRCGRIRLDRRGDYGGRRAGAIGGRNRRRIRCRAAGAAQFVEGKIAVVLEARSAFATSRRNTICSAAGCGFETLAGFILARLQKIPTDRRRIRL